MSTFVRKQYPLIISLALISALLIFSYWQIISVNGTFCYPLDDAFIHMAVGKNVGLYGNWGINTQDFGSASSSPLYTLLLALFFKLGVKGIMLAFWLNIVLVLMVTYTFNRLLQLFSISRVAATVILAVVIILTPLHFIALLGMEHILHLWLVLLFMYRAVLLMQKDEDAFKGVWLTALLGGLTILARFESLFLVAAVVGLLAWYRKIASAAIVLVISIIPLLAFGLYSINEGGYFLPNSILLKGGSVASGWLHIKQILQDIFINKLIFGNNTLTTSAAYPQGTSSLSGTSLLRFLLIVPILLLFLKPFAQGVSGKLFNLAIIFLLTAFQHMALASVDWLFRYEAYLIAIGIFVVGMLLYHLLHERAAMLWKQQGLLRKAIAFFLLIFTVSPLFVRAANAYSVLPKASRNIYEQQYQMGLFVQKYYNNKVVAVNDIGAVSYLGTSRIIDLWGLGNNDVAKSKIEKYYSTPYLQELIQKENVSLAIIYNSVFDHQLYDNWVKVAEWTISDNVVCAGNTIVFYAVHQDKAHLLRQDLKEFQAQLPRKVSVTYYPETIK